jgi:hypothetical protein
MPIVSDNLIHFLARVNKDSPEQQLTVFKSIIERGLRTGKIMIKFAQGGQIFNHVVCFTDIPLSECDEHTAIYGKFGIGFKKSYVKGCGGNPARYFVNYFPGQTGDTHRVENRGQLYSKLCKQFDLLLTIQQRFSNPEFALYDEKNTLLFSHEEIQDWLNTQLLVFSYDKEMGDLGPARDETHEIDMYYREREWRFVPSELNVISGVIEQVDDNYYYKFTRSDINMVVVPNYDSRVKVGEYLSSLSASSDSRLNAFSASPVPVICYDELRRW